MQMFHNLIQTARPSILFLVLFFPLRCPRCNARYLHSRSPPVVHTSLRPSKVLLSANDDVRISDFSRSFHGTAAQLRVEGGGGDESEALRWDARFTPPGRSVLMCCFLCIQLFIADCEQNMLLYAWGYLCNRRHRTQSRGVAFLCRHSSKSAPLPAEQRWWWWCSRKAVTTRWRCGSKQSWYFAQVGSFSGRRDGVGPVRVRPGFREPITHSSLHHELHHRVVPAARLWLCVCFSTVMLVGVLVGSV